MDGITAVRTIRKWERDGKLRPRIPIIAITANARPEQVTAALEAGMDDVCTKPFRILEIMEKMRDWVARVADRMSVDRHDELTEGDG